MVPSEDICSNRPIGSRADGVVRAAALAEFLQLTKRPEEMVTLALRATGGRFPLPVREQTIWAIYGVPMITLLGVPTVAPWVKNPTCCPRGCGFDPWPRSAGEGSSVAVSSGVGRRQGSDLALLWLWHRPAAVAPIQPLAWELP